MPLFDRDLIARARALRDAWEADELRAFTERQPESRPDSRTGSGLPVQRVYTPEDLDGAALEDIGLPGRYPFTRGPYPTMYRGRLWTMRQIAGFGTGEDTNGRFRYLIEQGQTGLSVDFDMPTLMGYDSDDPRSRRKCGGGAPATWRATTRSTSAAITSPRRGRRPSRRSPSPWPTPSPML